MIYTQKQTINEAWESTFIKIFQHGEKTDNAKYFRDEVVLIEVENPSVESKHPCFPMSQEDLSVINDYITTGKNEDKVVHEWTKVYYKRIFDNPNSQIEYVVKKLNDEPLPVGEVQISMWDKNLDQNSKVSPCTQILWFRKKFGKLEMHVHAHSSDAYKKLLMNMQEFVAIQIYVAKRINIPVGKYFHFVDSCHLHNKDLEKIDEIVKNLSNIL